MASFTGLGLMSGTSLDGLDVCCAEFIGDMNCDIWSYRVLRAHTFLYEDEWRERLANAASLPGLELVRLHYDYAHFMGRAVQKFLAENELKVNFVATHGHTVFHQPEQKLTFQLGDGETLATYLKCPLVTNFRVKDIALGGQGAPLVPSGERFLYSNVAMCLNLGGIANLGVRDGMGWDICPCNTVLNSLAQMHNPEWKYDKDGELASQGNVNDELLSNLNAEHFYKQPPPKSLGIERIKSEIWPHLDVKQYGLEDVARTFVEHVTTQITEACMLATLGTEKEGSTVGPDGERTRAFSVSSVRKHGDNVVLITGGGAHNKFLMKILERKLVAAGLALDKSDLETVDFKEALVFAYLGLRCLLGKENVFANTTGARENSVAGSIHQPALMDSISTSMYSHFRFLLRRQTSVP